MNVVDISDTDHECFDYIMNTRQSYEMLGESVRLLERLAKRMNCSIEETMALHWIAYGTVRSSVRVWNRKLRVAFRLAVKDFEKNFPDECPDWVRKDRLIDAGGASLDAVMTLALRQRDRWSL
jgi:hypothetical protein